MGLKIFQKKWEILEYLGEDKKNVRVIDRMIVKGEIVRWDDGEYILAKDILKEAFILLQITQREVSSRSDEIEKLRKELKAAKESVERRESDLEFQVEENEKKEDKIKKLQAMIDGIQDGANHRNAYMGD